MIRDKNFYKTILHLSLPSAIQSAANLLVVMADNVMVTRTGENALSAVNLMQGSGISNGSGRFVLCHWRPALHLHFWL